MFGEQHGEGHRIAAFEFVGVVEANACGRGHAQGRQVGVVAAGVGEPGQGHALHAGLFGHGFELGGPLGGHGAPGAPVVVVGELGVGQVDDHGQAGVRRGGTEYAVDEAGEIGGGDLVGHIAAPGPGLVAERSW